MHPHSPLSPLNEKRRKQIINKPGIGLAFALFPVIRKISDSSSAPICQVRRNLFGHSEAVYSGYTCYTGIADFVPADIETVGYALC